jgi:hypothetical protein
MSAMTEAEARKILGITDQGTDWSRIDTGLEYSGKKIVLPADPTEMPIPKAVDRLLQIEEMENQEFDVSEQVRGAPWDALVAIYKAMQEIYGVVITKSRMSWFGPIAPDFLSVRTGPGPMDVIQVPFGQMTLPGVTAPVNFAMDPSGCRIFGTVKRADRTRLLEIANKAREILRRESIYRGKAILLHVDDNGSLMMNEQPDFIDLSQVSEADMIHTRETEALIRTSIFTPLRYTAAARKNHIPLKRGILLEGPYGTGKSLTARVTAKVAAENGWTFIMLDKAQGLRSAINFAKEYQPAVIFAEDIDRAADRSDEDVNSLINEMDGLISKDMEIMTVLTTNFIEQIDQAMLRPGRFDAVISIQTPDQEAAIRLIRLYARDLLDNDADLSRAGVLLEHQMPAVIREVVERAKLAMLSEDRQQISQEDLEVTAVGMKRHMELLAPKKADESAAVRFSQALLELLGDSLAKQMGVDTEELEGGIEKANNGIKMVVSIAKSARDAAMAASAAGSVAAEEVRRVGEVAKRTETTVKDIRNGQRR